MTKGISTRELRKFAITMGLAFGALGGLLLWRATPAAAFASWGAGAFFLIVCLPDSDVGRRVYVAWMAGAAFLGRITTTVLLSVLFIVALPFFALIRLRDPLRLRGGRESYWLPRRAEPHDLERARRPF